MTKLENKRRIQRAYRARNLEKIRMKERERSRAKRVANPEAARRRARDLHVRAKFGITLAEQEALLLRQGNACAICKSPEPKGLGWHVDHCHDSKKVRGVLCNPCNRGIGYLQDDAALLRSAADYLSR